MLSSHFQSVKWNKKNERKFILFLLSFDIRQRPQARAHLCACCVKFKHDRSEHRDQCEPKKKKEKKQKLNSFSILRSNAGEIGHESTFQLHARNSFFRIASHNQGCHSLVTLPSLLCSSFMSSHPSWARTSYFAFCITWWSKHWQFSTLIWHIWLHGTQ